MKKKVSIRSLEERRQETVELIQRVENAAKATTTHLRNPQTAPHHADLIQKLTGLTIARAALNAKLTMLYEGGGK